MFEKTNNIRIKSILSVVPKNKQILNKKNASEKLMRVARVIGVESSFKTDSKSTVDLFLEASKEIIKKNKINKKKINILICVTQTPDYLMPSCSNIIHQKLELDEKCICFDINLGCSGYVYGLYVLMSLMNSSLYINNGILLAGDTISKVIKKNDSSNNLLFGDAVSATYLVKKKSNSLFLLGSGNSGFDKLMIKESGFKRSDKKNSNPEFYMDGKEVFSFAVGNVPKMINTLTKNKVSKKIDYYILHQANKMMLDKILDISKVNLKKRLFSIKEYGNTSSASIPLTISKNLKINNKSKICLLAGFGAGFSYASCIVDLSKTKIFSILKK